MSRTTPSGFGKRMVAIGAGMLLLGTTWTGIAVAQDGTTTLGTTLGTTTGATTDGATTDGTTTDGTTTDGATTDGTTTDGTTTDGTTTDGTTTTGTTLGTTTGTTTGTTLGTTTGTTTGTVAGVIPAFPGFPAFGDLPAFDPTASPTVACANVSSALLNLAPAQLSSALSSPAAQFCRILGLLPTGLGGDQTGTAIVTTPTADATTSSGSTESGSTTYTTDTPLYASQVSSVPSGGVNTGDGSFGP